MQRSKYRKFVADHPWFPAAIRDYPIDWESYGPGEKDPDRATEVFFYRKVSHLGVIPYNPNILRRKGMRCCTQLVRSPLLPTPLKAIQLKTHQVIYRSRNEEPFSGSHGMTGGSLTVHNAVKQYQNIIGYQKVDAIIELTLISFNHMSTHRFNVMLFPTN